MEQEYKVANGVKLYERKCEYKHCTNTFWVPASQLKILNTCSTYCRYELSIEKRKFDANKGRKRRKVSLRLKETDYE